MQTIGRKESLSTLAYQSIKNAIISGEFRPGACLKEEDLSKALAISRTPVREALRQLHYDHLIEKDHSHNFTVSNITPEDISQALEVRRVMESYCAKEWAKSITERDLQKLQKYYDKQTQALDKSDFESFLKYEEKFHSAIIHSKNNQYFDSYLAQIELLQKRFLILSGSLKPNALEAMKEHQALLDALAAHDAEKAQEAMDKHICNVEKRLLEED